MGLSIIFANFPFFSNYALITFSLPLCFCVPVVPLAPTGSKHPHSVMLQVINLWLISSHLSQSMCSTHSSRCPDNGSNPPLFVLWAVRLAGKSVVLNVITLSEPIPGAPLSLLQIIITLSCVSINVSPSSSPSPPVDFYSRQALATLLP